MTIDRLHSVLTAIGPPPMAREIADAVWLTFQLERLSVGLSSAPSGELTPLQPRTDGPLLQNEVSMAPKPTPDKTSADDRSVLYAAATTLAPGADAVALLVPSAGMLGERLAIQRALRPLKRRVPSRYDAVLDEGRYSVILWGGSWRDGWLVVKREWSRQVIVKVLGLSATRRAGFVVLRG